MEIKIIIRNCRFLFVDADAGGWVEANRKDFYFVDKNCKTPAQAIIEFGDTEFNFTFWYKDKTTLLYDLRYQANWHVNIANIPKSWGITFDEAAAEKIKDFFNNELSVRCSVKKAKMYLDFLTHGFNGFSDFCKARLTEEQQDFFDNFFDYYEDLSYPFELIYKEPQSIIDNRFNGYNKEKLEKIKTKHQLKIDKILESFAREIENEVKKQKHQHDEILFGNGTCIITRLNSDATEKEDFNKPIPTQELENWLSYMQMNNFFDTGSAISTDLPANFD